MLKQILCFNYNVGRFFFMKKNIMLNIIKVIKYVSLYLCYIDGTKSFMMQLIT